MLFSTVGMLKGQHFLWKALERVALISVKSCIKKGKGLVGPPSIKLS